MNTFFLKSMVLFILISYSAFGQIEKGTKLLGGVFHLSMDKSYSDKIYSVYAIPNLGIFLNNRLALGGAMNLGYSKYRDTRDVNIGIAPFLRYYFELNKAKKKTEQPAGEAGKTWLFLHVQPGVNWSQSRSNSGEKSSISSLGYTLGIGMTYLITDNIGLEGILSYNADEFIFSISGLVFNVGFQIYLPKGKKE